MASTPEGKVKAAVKKMLASFGDEVYSHWPVQNGMGSPTLDCIICAYGRYIAIETKAEGKKPTARQTFTIEQMTKAQAVVYVVSNDFHVEQVRHGLELLRMAHLHADDRK